MWWRSKLKTDHIKVTKAAFVILPMLGLQIVDLGDRFINVYVGDKQRPEYNDHILVFMKFYGSRPAMAFEESLEVHPLYVNRYEPIDGTTMYVFRIAEGDKPDYELYKQGKYSKLSDSLKISICNKRKIDEVICKACFPNDKHRADLKKYLEDTMNMPIKLSPDAEVLSIPDMNKEIFDIEISLK